MRLPVVGVPVLLLVVWGSGLVIGTLPTLCSSSSICRGSYCPCGIFERPLQITVRPIHYGTVGLSALSTDIHCNVGVLWPNGWMDQDTTWYGGRPRPRRRCLRWGPSSPHGKGHSSSPLFGLCLLWPNGRPSQQLLQLLRSRFKLGSAPNFGVAARRGPNFRKFSDRLWGRIP